MLYDLSLYIRICKIKCDFTFSVHFRVHAQTRTHIERKTMSQLAEIKMESKILQTRFQDYTKYANIRKRTENFSRVAEKKLNGVGGTCSQARVRSLGAFSNNMRPIRPGRPTRTCI